MVDMTELCDKEYSKLSGAFYVFSDLAQMLYHRLFDESSYNRGLKVNSQYKSFCSRAGEFFKQIDNVDNKKAFTSSYYCIFDICAENSEMQIPTHGFVCLQDIDEDESDNEFYYCLQDAYFSLVGMALLNMEDNISKDEPLHGGCNGDCAHCDIFDRECEFSDLLSLEFSRIKKGYPVHDCLIGHYAEEMWDYLLYDFTSVGFSDVIPDKYQTDVLLKLVDGFNECSYAAAFSTCGIAFSKYGQTVLQFLIEHKNDAEWKPYFLLVKCCFDAIGAFYAHEDDFLDYGLKFLDNDESFFISLVYSQAIETEELGPLTMCVSMLMDSLDEIYKKIKT